MYETGRLAQETHANAVIAAAITVAALVLVDYAHEIHPAWPWFAVALAGLVVTFTLATVTRFVSWETPPWRGGKRHRRSNRPSASAPFEPTTPPEVRPSDRVGSTLNAVREYSGDDPLELRALASAHWRARASSAFALSGLKDNRLRWSLCGFLGPAAYFAARLLT